MPAPTDGGGPAAASPLLVRTARLVPVGASAPASSEPVDVLVEGGRVTAVGAALVAPDGVRVVDADGRWLLPGLWDHHVHLDQWARTAARLDVSGTASPYDVLERVAAALPRHPAGHALVGYGYRSGGWDVAPSTAALDAVVGERLVVLVAGDGHNGWLSSAAQRFLGLAPCAGALDEDDWFAVWSRLHELPGAGDEARRGLVAAVDDAAARGVVGIVDMELGTSPEEWVARVESGVDRLRVRTSVYREHLPAAYARGLATGEPAPGGRGLVEMGPFKIISDGSLATRTAHCHEPYPARPGGEPGGGPHPAAPYGKQNVDGAELTALLREVTDHGLRAAVHVIGDAAAQIALDAFAASGARGSLEHAQLLPPGAAAAMARLGLVASVQPAHLLDDRDLTTAIWPGREDRCFMLRTLLDAGVTLALGSDAPVARLDPWLAMAAAVHRTADAREPWVPAEQLTAAEALAASTDGAGTVGVGSRADLVLVDGDPLAGDDAAASGAVLRGTRVALTVVGGRVTHDAIT